MLNTEDVEQGDVETEKKTTSKAKHMLDEVDGFDDEDLEKPNFPGKQLSAKLPLILSDPDKVPPVQVPGTINQYLRKYQREGIAFLYKQYSLCKGAILADDMGLGKTVQVIGFISALLGKTGTKMDIYGKYLKKMSDEKSSSSDRKSEKGAFLIVSPNSVLYNWHEELMTWGYFKIGKFHKNKRVETLERATADKLDVVLTTYETLRNHWESLNNVEWLAVIMDEVHHLKDPKAAVTVAAKRLKVKCRIGLTGTPLQNRFLDFWCVLDWANPGCLGEMENFANRFGKPIMQGQRFDVTKRELATGRKRTQEFQSTIDEWFLRRTKSLISKQLPHKDQKVVFCPLSKLQEDIYKMLLQTTDVQLVLKQGEPCNCRSGLSRGLCCYSENEEGCSVKKLMLQYLRLFLKVANHAALLLPQVEQTEQQRKRAAAVCEKVFAAHPTFKLASKSPSFELFSDVNFCGKMKVLDKLLKLFLQQKDKVLLFSYSTQLLEMLEAYVVSCGMVYRRLDGKTRGEQRLRIVREFNTNRDIFLFLVSTKAGGVGLNLTSANIVIVFDPSWNPANDLQAEDRAYRIGQRRDVKVFRMISSGTVEENMYLRQVYKQQLANVVVEGNNERRYFTAVDGEKDKKGELFGIENLFTLRSDGCCVASDIFKRSDKIERGFRMAKYELLPENEKVDEKPKRTCVPEECEEDEGHDLEAVTSQFNEDETLDDDIGLNGNNKKTVSNNGTEGNLSEIGHENVKKTESENPPMKFTKVRNVSKEKKLHKKRSQLPQSEEDWKRRKNQLYGRTISMDIPRQTAISKDSQVNQILEDCGVKHTHSNKSIIGTSRAENEMTSRAIKEVFELGQYSQQPANCFAAVESDGEESDDIGTSDERFVTKADEKEDSGKCCMKVKSATQSIQKKMSISRIGDNFILFGETPKTIRMNQFLEMSREQGYESEVDLAKVVVNSKTRDRLNILREYYKTKHYPKENDLNYPESIESSPEKISDNTKVTKRSTKSESPLKQTEYRCRRSSPKKSYTKVCKAPILKTSVTDWLEKDHTVASNDNVKNTELPSSSGQQFYTDIPPENEEIDINNSFENERMKTSDNNFKKANMPTLPTYVHTNILPNIIQTSESGDRIIETQGRDGKSTCNVSPCPLKSPATIESDNFQTSSFLDEFLYECSQQTCTWMGNNANISDNNRESEPNSNAQASHRELQYQTSVFDDLI